MGIIPTDTCYSFVTLMNNAQGIRRILKLKSEGMKKPLSLLCKDIATISKYSSNISDQKWVFKILKSSLPGPYTIILPSSKEVPSVLVDHNKHMRRWKRREIGVRIPQDDVCSFLTQSLDLPLISGSVPEFREDEDISDLGRVISDESYTTEDKMLLDSNGWGSSHESSWMGRWLQDVDFIVDNGFRGGSHADDGRSTVLDLTSGEAVVLRQGRGIFTEA